MEGQRRKGTFRRMPCCGKLVSTKIKLGHHLNQHQECKRYVMRQQPQRDKFEEARKLKDSQ